MTPNKRIFINIIASYGRSLLAMFCGIFTSRWVLATLGHVDYGLYGLVGGLTVFVAFFNGVLSGAVSRFYAYSVGKASAEKCANKGLQDCRVWFSLAVILHSIVPIILVVIGYPVGHYVVRYWLVIPVERITACVWVWRFVCISCFVNMVTVPYKAMFEAKQEIAELTVYSVAQSICTVMWAYYMFSCPNHDWLIWYAMAMMVMAVTPQLLIALRAACIFEECHFTGSAWRELRRLAYLGGYAGWQMFGALGMLMRAQGMSLVINHFFGPTVNAAMGVANTINGQANTLSAAMQTAFTPAITNACGADNMPLVRVLSYRACKFGMVLSLIFVLPLSLELDNVMSLWLVEPPKYAAGLCLFVMASLIINKSAVGHMVAISAT